MKKLITAAFALTVLAVTLGASAADARPHRHKICTSITIAIGSAALALISARWTT